jgi:hypothetical protein
VIRNASQRPHYSVAGAVRTAALEIWTHLPIWFVLLSSLGLYHAAIGIIDPSGYTAIGHSTLRFALTALVPAAWVVIYYAARARALTSTPSTRRTAWILSTLLLVVFLADWAVISWAPSLRAAASQRTLLVVFEYLQFTWFVALAWHASATRGVRAFATFFVVGLIYGAVLENTGIVLGFFVERNYRWYLPVLPAPVATMLGWSIIAYCGAWIADRLGDLVPPLGKTPVRLAVVATGVALSVDVQLDPLASLDGLCWKWNALLPTWFLSVPFCNYAAWLGAFLPFAWAVFWLRGRKDLTETQRNWRLFASVPLLSGAGGLIWLTLMTAYEGGVSGPTYQILGAFVDSILAWRF